MKQPGVVVDSGSFVVTKDNVGHATTRSARTSARAQKEFQNDLLNCK